MTCYGIVQHLHIPLLEILDLSGLDTQTETGILQDSCELIRQIVNFRYLLEFFSFPRRFSYTIGDGSLESGNSVYKVSPRLRYPRCWWFGDLQLLISSVPETSLFRLIILCKTVS